MDAKYFSTINLLDPVLKLMAARKSGVVINIIGSGQRSANSRDGWAWGGQPRRTLETTEFEHF
jgi:hypothetical protein